MLRIMLIKIFPLRKMPSRTRRTARKHIGPIGVPCHQLAPRHDDSSSGSNDPIEDLEAQVNRLQAELCRRIDIWAADGDRINEMRSDIRHLRDQLVDQDLALNWVVQSCSLAWAKEARAQARIAELNSAIDDLQTYCNTLHEEVHVLYSQLHPSEPADPVGTEAGPSHVAGEALGGELDLYRPPPSMRLVDEWSPTPDDEAARSNRKQE
jgi:HPt (histidine-containing phosphotransfer) domain-containing protein